MSFSDKHFIPANARTFSTALNTKKNSISSDLLLFCDADKDKVSILEYIKGKSGIYM